MYQLGRRLGIFSRLDDLENPFLISKVKKFYHDLSVTSKNIDDIALDWYETDFNGKNIHTIKFDTNVSPGFHIQREGVYLTFDSNNLKARPDISASDDDLQNIIVNKLNEIYLGTKPSISSNQLIMFVYEKFFRHYNDDKPSKVYSQNKAKQQKVKATAQV